MTVLRRLAIRLASIRACSAVGRAATGKTSSSERLPRTAFTQLSMSAQ